MKKNVASQVVGVQMITAADGSAFTGSVTALVTVDGGTQSASGGTGPTHEGNGFHTYLPTQAETNGDHVAFTFTGTGAIPTSVQVYTTFPQTVDNNVLAAGATGFAAIDTVVDAIKVKTDFLPSVTAGGNGGVFIAGTNAATVITGSLTTTFTGNLTGNVGGTINGLTATALADMFDTDSGTTYASAVAGSVVKEIADNAGGSALTAAAIADAVWDELATGHTDAGKAGEQLWTDVDAILADTGTAGVVVAAASKSGYRLSSTGIDDIFEETDSAHTTLSTFGALWNNTKGTVDANESVLATVDVATAAIQVVTDKFVFTVANQVDSNPLSWRSEAIVLPNTGGTPDVNVIDWAGGAVSFDAGTRPNVNIQSISGSTTAADNLEASTLGIIPGAAVTGTLSTTVMTSDLSGFLNDELIGRTIVWTGGVADGQASDITDYASASGTVTYTAITTAPANGDTFVII